MALDDEGTSMKPQIGGNLTKLKKDIVAGIKKIAKHKADRTSSNDEIAAIRSGLEAKGIHKAALDMAIKYSLWDEDKREGFDIAYEIAREAIALPFNPQGDLFEEKKPGDNVTELKPE